MKQLTCLYCDNQKLAKDCTQHPAARAERVRASKHVINDEEEKRIINDGLPDPNDPAWTWNKAGRAFKLAWVWEPYYDKLTKQLVKGWYYRRHIIVRVC